jgi:hypothetical protein
MEVSDLPKFSDRVINQERLSKLKYFAEVNPVQFRKFWLLVQYRQFRTTIDFATADYEVKKHAEQYALRGRDPQYLYSSKRSSRLGKMHEIKQKEFLDSIAHEDEMSWFNLLAFAAFQDIESLFNDADVGLVNSIGSRIPLDTEVWDAIDQEDTIALSQSHIRLPIAVREALGRFLEEA